MNLMQHSQVILPSLGWKGGGQAALRHYPRQGILPSLAELDVASYSLPLEHLVTEATSYNLNSLQF